MNSAITWVGMDAHEAAAIDVLTGEFRRARFGYGLEPVLEGLRALPQPVHIGLGAS